MEVEVERVADNEIRVLIRGETYTLITPIVDALNAREDVEFAGFDVPHPLKEESLIFLKVREGKDPIQVLKETVYNLISEYDELEKSFLEQIGGSASK